MGIFRRIFSVLFCCAIEEEPIEEIEPTNAQQSFSDLNLLPSQTGNVNPNVQRDQINSSHFVNDSNLNRKLKNRSTSSIQWDKGFLNVSSNQPSNNFFEKTQSVNNSLQTEIIFEDSHSISSRKRVLFDPRVEYIGHASYSYDRKNNFVVEDSPVNIKKKRRTDGKRVIVSPALATLADMELEQMRWETRVIDTLPPNIALKLLNYDQG